MAMARSFGNKDCHTNACRRVETKSTVTMVEDTTERLRAKPLLKKHGTSSAYLIEAKDAVVMGKV